MARGKARTRSSETPSAQRKSSRGKAPPSRTTAEVRGGDSQLSTEVLTLVSDRLGVPISQVSRMVEVIRQFAEEKSDTDRIIDEYRGDKSALIQILLQIQRENRWLPKSVLRSVCEKLGVPVGQAYRIATFYKAFSLTPQGRHRVAVCMGTACHVRGAPRLLDRVVEAVKIKPGETSPDQKFSLETVNCLGCCALGPVMVVDDQYHGNPSPEAIGEIVGACD